MSGNKKIPNPAVSKVASVIQTFANDYYVAGLNERLTDLRPPPTSNLKLEDLIGNTRSVCGMEIPPTYDQEDDDEENFKIDDDEEDKDVVADEQTQDVVPFVGNGNGQFSFSFGQEKYVRDKEDYKKIQKYLFDAYRVRIMARKGKPQEKNTDGTNGTDGRPYKVEILTLVASTNLSNALDLTKIAQASKNIEYNPGRFSPLIMRMKDPKSTALIFSTGKMIVAGVKTKEECDVAAKEYARKIRKCGIAVTIGNYEIQNISANGDLGFPVRLKELSQSEESYLITYEPEIFAGLIYSLIKPKVKAIIFVTGAVLMTGAKSEEDVYDAMQSIYPIARGYRND